MTENNINQFKKYIFNYTDKIDLKIDKRNASFAKYIITNSYFSRESILRVYGFNSYVSYLGIDNELFKPTEIPREDFVLSVGTVTPTKGYDFIIKSLGLIEEEIRPKFIIIANHSEIEWKNYIKQLANDLKVELEILDLIDDEELTNLYNRAKIVLYTPYLEPFGLVPLEAMSCGTPVIGVKEGGIRESVIHNKTGLLIERDEKLFAKAIIKLLKNDEIRDEMSKNARITVNKSWTLTQAGERLYWHLKRAII
jgi:glycosyltransferase involved in cell wall biosynthesis